MRAAPFRSGVERDGLGFGDALAPVVADPIQRLALDLHPSRFGHGGRAVEHDHEGAARVVGDSFEPAPETIGQPVAPRRGESQRLWDGDREHESLPDHPQPGLAHDLPTRVAIIHPYNPFVGANVESPGDVFRDGGHAIGSSVAGVAVFVWLASCVGEAARPLRGDTCLEPTFDEAGEAFAPDGEELCAVVEVSSADPPGGHPAAYFGALFQNRNVPPFLSKSAGREQARYACPYDDAGFAVGVVAHVRCVSFGLSAALLSRKAALLMLWKCTSTVSSTFLA